MAGNSADGNKGRRNLKVRGIPQPHEDINKPRNSAMADPLVLKQIRQIFMQNSAEKLTGALSPDWGSGKEGRGVACTLDPMSIAEEVFCIFFLLFFCCCESKWPKRREVTPLAQSKETIFFTCYLFSILPTLNNEQ